MANKRTLKRAIHLVCEELFTETVAMSMYGPEEAKPMAEALLFSIARTERDYISRISHPEPGMKASDYYKDLTEKFTAQASDFVDQLNG